MNKVHVSIFKGNGQITEIYNATWTDVLAYLAFWSTSVRNVHVGTERLTPNTKRRTPRVHILECD